MDWNSGTVPVYTSVCTLTVRTPHSLPLLTFMARETTIRPPDDDDHDVEQAFGGRSSFSPGNPGIPADDASSELEEELRPSRLNDVIGQLAVVERIRILLEAAKKRGEPLGHLLLDGPPGLGKTTLAMLIPKELGTDFQITAGPSLSAPKDLLPYLTNAGAGSVLFIDEIHRMPPAVEEFIYPAMEDFRVDITLGDGLNARTINMQLQPFTVIGATTRSGMLTAPLRDRFVNREHLSFYSVAELTTIIRRNSARLRTEISEEAAHEIAIRSRGTPRKANNWLRWTRDYADARSNGRITLEVARKALEMKAVDPRGLEELDRQYINTIISVFGGGPAGVQAIAHTMNIPADTLEDEIEPYLLREGLIQRTPRGRTITADAWKHVGKKPPEDNSGSGKNAGQGQLF
ncbi:MAG: Holliday junction branch migration DNA helicase RuvB [Planctomycetaceae bacterium]